MNGTERARISLIITHEVDLARRAYTHKRSSIYAEHSAAGRLQSGSTVKAVVAVMRQTLVEQVASLDGKVRPIARDKDAFSLLTGAVNELSSIFLGELSGVVSMATGGKDKGSVENAAAELYAQAEADARNELAILAFEYGPKSVEKHASAALPVPTNKGGKPLAAHWDAMWAEIAVRLWEGDLKPTKQKDISDAMFAWLSNEGIDAGQTAVTDRARTLWLRVEAKLRG